MTEQTALRKAIRHWLEYSAKVGKTTVPLEPNECRVLLAMLEEPCMPMEPTRGMLLTMQSAWNKSATWTDVYLALCIYLLNPPKPATRTVWHLRGEGGIEFTFYHPVTVTTEEIPQ